MQSQSYSAASTRIILFFLNSNKNYRLTSYFWMIYKNVMQMKAKEKNGKEEEVAKNMNKL